MLPQQRFKEKHKLTFFIRYLLSIQWNREAVIHTRVLTSTRYPRTVLLIPTSLWHHHEEVGQG